MPEINEKTIFRRITAGAPGFDVVGGNAAVDGVALDLPRRGDACGGMQEATEIDVIRHYTRLSNQNFDIDRGMYPLGSCTMKHNPRVNEAVAADPYWASPHPLWPARYLEAHHRIMDEIIADLKEVSGFEEVSLLPAAGAHGELTATFMMKAYHEDRGNHQKTIILTPDT
ncbi:MAG: aminomethyl-transferring glycine dehydrogenase subunit GcvPB, partial [Planctomycetes bacterium]|nr:aminomethyl-transferring glycine dehydrogenase subunit GcvPB [Planctomycetota bacterium]